MKYNIDDYVLLNLDEIIKNNEKDQLKMILPSDNFAKIIDIGDDMEYPYFVKLYDDRVFFNNENEIIRKLTSDEISIFNNKIEKYNNIKEI